MSASEKRPSMVSEMTRRALGPAYSLSTDIGGIEARVAPPAPPGLPLTESSASAPFMPFLVERSAALAS